MAIELIEDPASMRRWSRHQHQQSATIALVPTMGALHDGHRALIDRARQRADRVVVSIFVNPLQFDRPDDLAAYPVDFENDRALCADAGVAAIYAPQADTMYPPGSEIRVDAGPLSTSFEGAARPGHFQGMLTVVTKLFAATEADVAIFGEKDAQQLALVRRLALDLDLSPQIVAHPTVREADGLAMSSRNRRLNDQQRRAARCIPEALGIITSAFEGGTHSPEALCSLALERLRDEPSARIDYLSIVNPDTFVEFTDLDHTPSLVITAVWIDDIRLIDNRWLVPRQDLVAGGESLPEDR